MGLKLGEYGDKLIILTPDASILGAIEAILCAGRLSITTTAPNQADRPQGQVRATDFRFWILDF
jgi:hypothetical protein